jgi:plastocyanin
LNGFLNLLDVKIAVSVGVPIVGALLLPILISVPVFAANVPVSITLGSQSKTTDAFSPNPVEVKVGDTVNWTNSDSTPHTVTSGSDATPDGKFDSSPGLRQLLIPGRTFSHTFDEAGKYPYYCGLHPNMIGTVIVASGGGDNGEPSQPTNVNPMTLPIIVVAILAVSIAAIIGYTKLARKRAGFSEKA